jgi:hypothetical protein
VPLHKDQGLDPLSKNRRILQYLMGHVACDYREGLGEGEKNTVFINEIEIVCWIQSVPKLTFIYLYVHLHSLHIPRNAVSPSLLQDRSRRQPGLEALKKAAAMNQYDVKPSIPGRRLQCLRMFHLQDLPQGPADGEFAAGRFPLPAADQDHWLRLQ